MTARSRHSDAAILAATIAILAEHGVDGLAVDAVAAAAGVSKATIYRRGYSRTELIHAAILSLQRPLSVPDSGSLRTDLIVLMNRFIAYLGHGECGGVFASFIEAASREHQLEELRRRQLSELRAAHTLVLERAVARTELSPDVDIELFVDLLMAPVVYRSQLERADVPDDYAEALIDMLLGTFCVDAAGPAEPSPEKPREDWSSEQ
jgi:AcrR family transcriptional regulator